MSLPSQLKSFLLVRLIQEAVQELEAKHVGTLLDVALDKQFGAKESERMQAKLVGWLRGVIAELEADHA